MSDRIPITFHFTHRASIDDIYGPTIGRFLATANPTEPLRIGPKDKAWPKPLRPGQYRVESYSRGGFIAYALGKLFEQSGFDDLGLLASSAHTHEVIVEDEGEKERFFFTVITDGYEQLIARTQAFLQWCRDHQDAAYEQFEELGHAVDGRDFEDIADVVDNTDYSMHPNDDYCDADSWNAPLAVSTLKTFIRLLMRAKHAHPWFAVIVEHWGGVDLPEDALD
jgi:hypothetical protein